MTFVERFFPARRHNAIYAALLVVNILMAGVVMEQGRVIESQRVLIKSLFYDTASLAALKLKQAASH